MYLTTICQKNKTYNAILTTNGLTVTSEPLLKIWSLLKNNFLIWQIIKWERGDNERERQKINGTILSELSDQTIKRKGVRLQLWTLRPTCEYSSSLRKTKWTISTYNKSRKKQSHIYIMAQAYWEKKRILWRHLPSVWWSKKKQK